jgi:(p)ppGpp synthase/HD superfamily hydrolase
LRPQSYHAIRAELANRMRESQRVLEEKKLTLERALSTTPAVRNAIRSVQIKGRIKGTYSCYRKIVRKGKSLSDIYDLLALRIIVQARGPDAESQASACYAVADAVRKSLPTVPARAKDYVAHPKPNGYRSLHLTVAPTEDSPTPLEIQIRTEKMHYVAEYGAAAHWVYKAADSPEPKLAVVPSSDLRAKVGGGEKALLATAAGAASDLALGLGSELTASDLGFSDLSESAPSSSTILSEESDDDHAGGSGSSSGQSHEGDDLDSLSDVNQRFAASLIAQARDADFERNMTERRRIGEHEIYNRRRGGYMNALVSAITASRVIVLSCGHLYRLTVGSTLHDLACRMGMASRGMIALVNGIPVPLSHRLQMSDTVRWL